MLKQRILNKINISQNSSQSAHIKELWKGEYNLKLPLNILARTFVLNILKQMNCGEIVLTETWQGSSTTFGKPVSATNKATPWAAQNLKVHLTVKHPKFYRRVLLGGNIGAGESFVSGEWDVDDLTTLIRILVRNKQLVSSADGVLSTLSKGAAIVAHKLKHNSKDNAKDNILAHYDVGNAMYKRFLDPSMMYSSAMYPSPSSSLSEAQTHKLKTICDKLQLQPTDHVIEIGTGWGGLALYAAQHYGCNVTTTTISDAQHEEALQRIQAAGLEDKITLLKSDYRDLLSVTGGGFDKLVSIEMIEAVGHGYLDTFFDACNSLLKPNGMMLLQAITYIDQEYKNYLRSADFMQKHIFPGGCLLSLSDLLQRYKNNTDMTVRAVQDFGLDYAHTLHDWCQAFLASRNELSNLNYDEAFMRLWRFYFCYCEGAFLERNISVVQLVASKPNNRLAI